MLSKEFSNHGYTVISKNEIKKTIDYVDIIDKDGFKYRKNINSLRGNIKKNNNFHILNSNPFALAKSIMTSRVIPGKIALLFSGVMMTSSITVKILLAAPSVA